MNKCEAYSTGTLKLGYGKSSSSRAKSGMIAMASILTLLSIEGLVQSHLKLDVFRVMMRSMSHSGSHSTQVTSRSNRR